MGTNNAMIFRLPIITIFVMISCLAFGQRPIIKTTDRSHGANQDFITITGSNFGEVISNLRITFGSTNGTIQYASEQLLEARVPAGTTFSNISVTNVESG